MFHPRSGLCSLAIEACFVLYMIWIFFPVINGLLSV
uniref:Uncharacterized protein n=1 Tax=Anguilla anguilla TaxID=7936 RepID=A0A0E9VQQ8_ANGAN